MTFINILAEISNKKVVVRLCDSWPSSMQPVPSYGIHSPSPISFIQSQAPAVSGTVKSNPTQKSLMKMQNPATFTLKKLNQLTESFGS